MYNFLLHSYKLIFLLSLPLLLSCGGNDTNTDVEAVEGNWYRPAPTVTWQWQLQGTINTSYDVEIYDIDLFDSPANLIQQLQNEGRKVICYFSAGSYENYRNDANDFDPADLGNLLDGWPDEQWLDIRSDNVRQIMQNRLDIAVTKGCDGVEPDNMDGYLNNPWFPLTDQHQVDFNRFIANEAHTRNLSVGLKNALGIIPELIDYYDFSVNEQCFEYDECNALTPFIQAGKAVLNTEYDQQYISDTNSRNNLCTESLNLQFSTLILPLDLDDSSRDSCQ